MCWLFHLKIMQLDGIWLIISQWVSRSFRSRKFKEFNIYACFRGRKFIFLTLLDRMGWFRKGGRSQRDPQDVTDTGRRPVRNIYRPAGWDHFEKIFSDRRTQPVCRTVCREPCTDNRKSCVHYRPRSCSGSRRKWKKRIWRKAVKQTDGRYHWEQGRFRGK